MFENIRNSIDFFIRNKTKFSLQNFVEKNPELIKRNFQENLYTKELLNQYFEKKTTANIRILDIGCKNWFYAKGEHDFFADFCKDFQLDGVEIDAYRLYNNFYTRYEVAKFYTKDLSNTFYIADDLLNISNKYDYIIWFLPFVIIEPLKAWGLPNRFFCPQKLLKHAYSLLNPNGQMLIINQGEVEASTQRKLLEDLKISYKDLGEVKNQHFEYKYKRYGYLIKK